MTGKDIYKIWAPEGAKWVEWVRPVPFIGITDDLGKYQVDDFTIPKINSIQEPIENIFSAIKDFTKNTAIIIDLPGNNSIKEGIAITKLGFRPIPIYNGTDEQEGAMATVNNKVIKIGLVKGALELTKIQMDKNAPPAFLLDSNRMNRYKMNESVFDNSWDIYAQDIPSAEYFLKNDINKIIIIGKIIHKDLKIILYPFQQKGISIYLTNGYEQPQKIILKKPHNKTEEDL